MEINTLATTLNSRCSQARPCCGCTRWYSYKKVMSYSTARKPTAPAIASSVLVKEKPRCGVSALRDARYHVVNRQTATGMNDCIIGSINLAADRVLFRHVEGAPILVEQSCTLEHNGGANA